MRTLKNKIIAFAAVLALLASSGLAVAQTGPGRPDVNPATVEKIRKKLVTLPYFGVFDNLAFDYDGETVTLYGQVLRPSTRKGAEDRVEDIEGVERVVNNIEVLPASSYDNRIRLRAYRAIFNTGSLYRYAMGANPSIHIVVNRGRITLEGVVANNGDRTLAYTAARSVPGVFSVTNNLRVEGGR